MDAGEGAARRLAVLVATAVWGLFAVAWLLKLGESTQDDFFISFTYARNLVEGQGFAFNPGERVFGLTNPGFTLLLALVHFITRLPIHLLGNAVSGLSLLLVVALLLREGHERRQFAEALVGGTLVLGSSYLWSNVGGEWTCVLALFLVACSLSERHPALTGVLMGLAVWFRPDAGIGVALLGLLLWVRNRRLPIRYGIAAAATIGLGALLVWLYFGSLVPNSLVAKKAMAFSEGHRFAGARFWLRILPLLERHFGALWIPLAILGGIGVGAWWRRTGLGGRLLILYGLSLAIYYPLSAVQFFSWYVAPCVVVLLMGVGYIICGLGRYAASAFSAKRLVPASAVALFAAAGLVPVLFYAASSARWYRGFEGYPHLETYRRAAAWLATERPPEERIAYVEIGVLGYFGRHPIQDLMGLVSPEVLPYVERGDIVGAFLVRPTDLVIFHSRGRMGPIVSSPWFVEAYEKVAYFEEQGRAGEPRGLTIYQRRQGTVLPAPPA